MEKKCSDRPWQVATQLAARYLPLLPYYCYCTRIISNNPGLIIFWIIIWIFMTLLVREKQGQLARFQSEVKLIMQVVVTNFCSTFVRCQKYLSTSPCSQIVLHLYRDQLVKYSQLGTQVLGNKNIHPWRPFSALSSLVITNLCIKTNLIVYLSVFESL